MTLPTPGSTNHLFDAPAHDQYDQIVFAFRHADVKDSVLSPTFNVNAAAQLWRQINQPTNFQAVAVDNATRARLTWTNQHLNSPADSTEVYRNAGMGWTRVTTVSKDSAGFTDSPPSGGTYQYSVRHVTAIFDEVDVGELSRPNSPATAPDTVTLGPAAPFGLSCEGNFAPTMDCRWYNSVAGDSTQIFRDNDTSPRATLSGGGVGTPTTWIDPSVTRGVSYSYKVRHIEGGFPGAFGDSFSAVADPVPPEAFYCAGEDPADIVCEWVDKEPDTVSVERMVDGDWSVIAEVPPGAMVYDDSGLNLRWTYYYRVRHRHGAEFTVYSNTVSATPGGHNPLGPGEP